MFIVNISGCNNQVKEQILEDESYYKIYYVNNLEDKLQVVMHLIFYWNYPLERLF